MSAPRLDAFETLGIAPRLVISEEAVRDAFRVAGKQAHPDAGGGDESFARLNEAFGIVSSPSRRLRHWFELRGETIEPRGTVGPQVMDLFSEVGEVSQRAEVLIRRRDEAKSALGRALLERETQACREAVEQAISRIERAITGECAHFGHYENAAPAAEAAVSVRNLAFLEKWRHTLRGLFSRLV
jgi:curved DNA-binding protein CbpA